MLQISGLKSSNIKWLSVWCRKFRVNFGDMVFEKSTTPKSTESKANRIDNPIVILTLALLMMVALMQEIH